MHVVWPTNWLNELSIREGRLIPKTQKIVVDDSLLNTDHNNVRIKGKVEQSSERSTTVLYTSVLQLTKSESSVTLD